jgi:hypothetical protein
MLINGAISHEFFVQATKQELVRIKCGSFFLTDKVPKDREAPFNGGYNYKKDLGLSSNSARVLQHYKKDLRKIK